MIASLGLGALFKKACAFVFDNAVGKAIAGGALALGVFGLWLWQHDAKVAEVAKTEVITTVNEDAEKLADKAVKAREPASRSGAFERLRKTSCSDCKG